MSLLTTNLQTLVQKDVDQIQRVYNVLVQVLGNDIVKKIAVTFVDERFLYYDKRKTEACNEWLKVKDWFDNLD